MIPIDLTGRRALVMGVSNARSLGWAIAERLRAAGAELAFSYQGERLKEDLEKLTREMPGTRLYQCDVTEEGELQTMFDDLREAWAGSTSWSTRSASRRGPPWTAATSRR